MYTQQITILVVDDDRHDLMALSAHLSEAFPRAVVLTAEGGREGIARARETKPDVILLGIFMAEVDGFAVCHALKAEEQFRGVPVVFMSAIKDDTASRIRALDAGAEGFLGKPIDACELEAQIRAMAKLRAAYLQSRRELSHLEELVAERTRELSAELKERSRIEDAFSKSSVRYKLLFNSSNDTVFVHGLNDDGTPGCFTDVNNVACDRLGISRDELLTMTPLSIDSGEMNAGGSSALAALRRDGHAVFEMVHIGRNGALFPVEISSRVFVDDDVPCVLSIARDVTERNRSIEELRRSSVHWRATFDAVADVVLVLSLSHDILEINRAGLAFLGKSRDEIVGRKCFELVHCRNMPIDVCPCAYCVRTGSTDVVVREYTENGQSFELTALPILGADGGITSFAHIIRNVTEQKNLSARLRQSEKLEAVGLLAGGIAHDFNNVLSGIIGFTDLSFKYAPSGSLLERNLNKIMAASERAKKLVQQILKFSRQNNPNFQTISIQPVVLEVMDLVRASIPSSVLLDVDVTGDFKNLHADATMIHEVLLNLVTNAVQAMDRKGILLVRVNSRILDAPMPGRIGEISPGEYVVLEIADTGSGMDAGTLALAFDPFYTTKPVGEGTGMGLSVVLGIVQSHGGDVQVESTPGVGTTFRVYLPVSGLRESGSPQSITIAQCSGSERVLYVDDEEILVEIAEDMLGDLGYAVVGMSDSIQALAYLQTNSSEIDILVTDQTMPILTGMELARAALAIRPDLPIILCTGYGGSDVNIEVARAAGIAHFSMKPFGSYVLARSIREVLEARKPGGTHG